MVSPVECVTNELGDDKVQERKTPEGEIHAEQPISHNGLDAPQPGQEHATPVEDPKKPPVLDIVVHSLDKDNGGNLSRESDKTPKVEDIKPIASSRPGANAYVIPEKVPEDGYNWRKYGQKFVKGNEFVRSYYKCTHLHCHVKKQLERSHDGRIKDMVYFGEHDHPKPMDHVPVEKEKSSNAQSHTPRQNRLALIPQPLPLPATPTEELKAPPQSNKSSSEVGTADDPSSKKRKKENNNADETPVEKPSNDMRTVVRTLSEVDLVNDGYRWRKYGQKLVKGSPHPRSYYRCSSPACPVKKHVERASHDNKMVITTYEGRHDHDLPPSRTVTPNAAGPNFHTTTQKEETGSRSEGNDSARHKMVSHPGSYPHPENISNAQLNGELRAKLEVSRHDIKEVAVATSVPVSRSDEVEVEGIKSESNKA